MHDATPHARQTGQLLTETCEGITGVPSMLSSGRGRWARVGRHVRDHTMARMVRLSVLGLWMVCRASAYG